MYPHRRRSYRTNERIQIPHPVLRCYPCDSVPSEVTTTFTVSLDIHRRKCRRIIESKGEKHTNSLRFEVILYIILVPKEFIAMLTIPRKRLRGLHIPRSSAFFHFHLLLLPFGQLGTEFMRGVLQLQ